MQNIVEAHIKFNTVLDEFLCKLINKFNSNKLKSYRRYLLMITEVDKEMPSHLFMAGCLEYKDKINSRDSDFFINSDKINNTAKMFGSFSSDTGIKEYWNELNDVTKNSIWEYMQTLFVLGNVVINKNKKKFEKFNNARLSDYENDIKEIDNKFSTEFLQKINS